MVLNSNNHRWDSSSKISAWKRLFLNRQSGCRNLSSCKRPAHCLLKIYEHRSCETGTNLFALIKLLSISFVYLKAISKWVKSLEVTLLEWISISIFHFYLVSQSFLESLETVSLSENFSVRSPPFERSTERFLLESPIRNVLPTSVVSAHFCAFLDEEMTVTK